MQKRKISLAEVARRLHVSRQTVSRWMKDFRRGGEFALQKAGRAGRKPKLPKVDRIALESLLESILEGPDVQASVWTCRSVADLIEQVFGIKYHPGHVWKILNQLGCTCQQQPGSSRHRVVEYKRLKPSSFQDFLDSQDRKLRRILEKMGRSD